MALEKYFKVEEIRCDCRQCVEDSFRKTEWSTFILEENLAKNKELVRIQKEKILLLNKLAEKEVCYMRDQKELIKCYFKKQLSLAQNKENTEDFRQLEHALLKQQKEFDEFFDKMFDEREEQIKAYENQISELQSQLETSVNALSSSRTKINCLEEEKNQETKQVHTLRRVLAQHFENCPTRLRSLESQTSEQLLSRKLRQELQQSKAQLENRDQTIALLNKQQQNYTRETEALKEHFSKALTKAREKERRINLDHKLLLESNSRMKKARAFEMQGYLVDIRQLREIINAAQRSKEISYEKAHKKINSVERKMSVALKNHRSTDLI